MLTVYLACLLLGGSLVMFSLLGGAFDGDMDVDADVDVDADADADADAGDEPGDLSLGWLPLSSMRFWTFLLAFGGLSGALLTWLGSWPAPGVAAAALGVGYLSGLGITRAVQKLRLSETGRSLGSGDFVGMSGQVLISVGQTQTGQVRVEMGGRFVDRMAVTEDLEPIGVDAPVLVYGVRDDGVLQVTRVAALGA